MNRMKYNGRYGRAPVRHGRARIETSVALHAMGISPVRPSAMDGRGLKPRYCAGKRAPPLGAPVRHGRARIETDSPIHENLELTGAPVRHGRARIETGRFKTSVRKHARVRPSAMDGRGLKRFAAAHFERRHSVRPSAMDGRGLKPPHREEPARKELGAPVRHGRARIETLPMGMCIIRKSRCARPPWTGED